MKSNLSFISIKGPCTMSWVPGLVVSPALSIAGSNYLLLCYVAMVSWYLCVAEWQSGTVLQVIHSRDRLSEWWDTSPKLWVEGGVNSKLFMRFWVPVREQNILKARDRVCMGKIVGFWSFWPKMAQDSPFTVLIIPTKIQTLTELKETYDCAHE